MLPFFRIELNDCKKVLVELSYGCMDCGHNAVCFKVGIIWWTIEAGVEFGS